MSQHINGITSLDSSVEGLASMQIPFLEQNDAALIVLKFEELRPFQVNSLVSLLSSEEKKRLYKLSLQSSVNQFVIAHSLKRSLLSIVSGISPDRLIFRRGHWGKPMLVNSDYSFNLSHTEGCVALLLSNSLCIGVDVERVRSVREEVWNRVLSSEERRIVVNHSSPMQKFIEFWVLKEAVAKSWGMGLTMPIQKIECHNRTQGSKLYHYRGNIAYADSTSFDGLCFAFASNDQPFEQLSINAFEFQ